jgi:F-type H+-transporting ATPase subunit b
MMLFWTSFAAPAPLLAGSLLDPEPGLMVWTVVTFAVLLAVLWKFAWRPLLNALEHREKTIQSAVESAQKLKDEAQKLMEEYQRQLNQAREEARAIVDEGRRDADVLRKDIEEKAHEQARQAVERAQREIALASDKAIDQLRREAVNLSIEMASKLIKQKLSAKDHQDLVRTALQEIEARK